MPTPYLISSLFLTLLGTGALFSAWRRSVFARRWFVPMGWLLLLLALVSWSALSGIEFGPVYALLSIAVCAWAWVLSNARQRSERLRQRELSPGPAANTRGSDALRHVQLFVLVIPLAGCATMLLSVSLAQGLITALNWHAGNAMVSALLLAPLLWGLAAYWACADPLRYRPALVLLSLIVLCSIVLFV